MLKHTNLILFEFKKRLCSYFFVKCQIPYEFQFIILHVYSVATLKYEGLRTILRL